MRVIFKRGVAARRWVLFSTHALLGSWATKESTARWSRCVSSALIYALTHARGEGAGGGAGAGSAASSCRERGHWRWRDGLLFGPPGVPAAVARVALAQARWP